MQKYLDLSAFSDSCIRSRLATVRRHEKRTSLALKGTIVTTKPSTASRAKWALPLALCLALFGLLTTLTPAAAQDGARIHLLHGIPGIAVDVEAGGANAIEGFEFGDTQDLSSFAGSTLPAVKVKVAGTDTVAIDLGDLALPATGNLTAVAHLDADGTPTVSIFSNDVSQLAAGNGRLTVRHTAAAPAVDVLANGAAAITNLPNGDGQGLDLGAGTISASVVPAGATEPVVIGPADLTITEGSSLIVYAVGSLDDGSLTVLTESIDGLQSPPARVDTGNSPVSDAGAASTTAILAIATAAFGVVALGARRVQLVEAGR